ncbi:hypothetical protein [Ewingella americana]|uniref:Uncharacterized protein n=1 Tax=Ewingella americana TaxID=41202 RepID=A0A502GGG7_9GAMM|nr:hypothetical protein [Ewingella americana]TPG60056.1 hypothetical protein EAH77_15935 [Ewingella americana]
MSNKIKAAIEAAALTANSEDVTQSVADAINSAVAGLTPGVINSALEADSISLSITSFQSVDIEDSFVTAGTTFVEMTLNGGEGTFDGQPIGGAIPVAATWVNGQLVDFEYQPD